MPLEKLLESSFIGNLTDDATDRLYQAAAEATLQLLIISIIMHRAAENFCLPEPFWNGASGCMFSG
jgi:hypothetical protein